MGDWEVVYENDYGEEHDGATSTAGDLEFGMKEMRIHYDLAKNRVEIEDGFYCKKRVGKKPKKPKPVLNLNKWEFPRRDGVDFSLQCCEKMGNPVHWKRPDVKKKAEVQNVRLGIWQFEQKSRSKFDSLTKKQILHILDNLPVKLNLLFKEVDNFKPPTESTKKNDLVILLQKVEDLLIQWNDDHDNPRQQQQEQEEKKSDHLDASVGDEEHVEQTELEQHQDSLPHKSPIQVRAKPITDTFSIVTPRNARVMSKVFFKN